MILITILAVIAKVVHLLVLTGKQNLTYHFPLPVRKTIILSDIAILDQHHRVRVVLVKIHQGRNDRMPVVNPI